MGISTVRIAVPRAAKGQLKRYKLIETVLNASQSITYIHAGAGFGKTTLLSQTAAAGESTVWVTLDGEDDVYAFLNLLSEALSQVFQEYSFHAMEYFPFEDRSSFITILANAFISSVEKLQKKFMLVLDDLHTIEEPSVRKLIACMIKYKPEQIKLCLSSREAPWQEFIPLRVRGSLLELNQKDLAFTKEECQKILGIDSEEIYRLTEGWPLAVGSFQVLLKNGVSADDIPVRGNEALYSYLFYECTSRLSPDIVEFLKTSAWFEELEPCMLDAVLELSGSQDFLENLVARNIFTVKSGRGYYRYHPLLREYLTETGDKLKAIYLQKCAADYYFENKRYSQAAGYALRLEDRRLLGHIILQSYREHIKKGNFGELRVWFHFLGEEIEDRELLVAKGAFLSSIGNFTQAQVCLDRALPLIGREEQELFTEAMIHKARVLRNFISFEASNKLLEELIEGLEPPASEQAYSVLIEKIYNLCWHSHIREAYGLAYKMIELCAQAGNLKVKAWYERYLAVINYVAGRMKDSVYYYEKSLQIPEEERNYLDMHNTEVYVAKAYQMLGQRDKAVELVTRGLQKLINSGRYEELWLGYLFAAEIHYQNTTIDRMNGDGHSYDTTIKYFTLANEYAPLYRKTRFQMVWAKLQNNISSLMFTEGDKEKQIYEIYEGIPQVDDHFKTIAFGRLYNYFGSIQDYERAAQCAHASIEIGERADTMMVGTIAYGFLARIALAKGDNEETPQLIRRFLKLCEENGSYEYFRMHKAYGPILEYALKHGIEPEFTEQMIEFSGCRSKKVYVELLGGLSVFSDKEQQLPLKMRTKKERELFAFLLNSGDRGATKEQICEALWSESDSEDIKRLIGVNLAQINKDFAVIGIQNIVVNKEKHYSIRKDVLETDTELFETAIREYTNNKSEEAAQLMLELYKGEYLAGFEAHWAVAKRLRYERYYNELVALYQ